MKRVILTPLRVQVPAGEDQVLPAGSIVSGFHIVYRADAYVVEFECERQSLWCPLHAFLPRTDAVVAAVDPVRTLARAATV